MAKPPNHITLGVPNQTLVLMVSVTNRTKGGPDWKCPILVLKRK